MTPQTFPFGLDSSGLDLTAHGLWRIRTKNRPDRYGQTFVYYAESDCFLANPMLISQFLFGLCKSHIFGYIKTNHFLLSHSSTGHFENLMHSIWSAQKHHIYRFRRGVKLFPKSCRKKRTIKINMKFRYFLIICYKKCFAMYVLNECS